MEYILSYVPGNGHATTNRNHAGISTRTTTFKMDDSILNIERARSVRKNENPTRQVVDAGKQS